MLRTQLVEPNKNFVGREFEQKMLQTIGDEQTPAIIILYGRRRVGKTELLEQTFGERNILKFEGIEGESSSYQMQNVMQQLAEYAQQPLLRDIRIENWVDVFRKIYEYTKVGRWTLYFEELQWLACYETKMISELKYAWDNMFRKNPELLIVLCGSAPSFMIKKVVHSKALYNRSQHELYLRELNLLETKAILGNRSEQEVMDAYLTVGGIPEYLLRLNQNSSVLLSLCDQSFLPESFFSKEFDRIFISSMANHKHYRGVIEYLSKHRFSTREKILKHLKVSTGGRATELFEDLELCNFISRYTPYNLKEDSPLARYRISDAYLHFYYKFIKPNSTKISDGVYRKNSLQALKLDNYYKWLGHAFERFCVRYHHIIANMLGFGRVNYTAGPYFSRTTDDIDEDFQIDLVFDRDDKVITVCEIRYLQSTVGTSVINEFEKKLENFPNPKNKTIHRVLISKLGANQQLINRAYFDDFITQKMFFESHIW